jgi:hypothetical protein
MDSKFDAQLHVIGERVGSADLNSMRHPFLRGEKQTSIICPVLVLHDADRRDE